MWLYKVPRNGGFPTRDDLIDKLMRFIADYDTTAMPFAWTYAGGPTQDHHARDLRAAALVS